MEGVAIYQELDPQKRDTFTGDTIGEREIILWLLPLASLVRNWGTKMPENVFSWNTEQSKRVNRKGSGNKLVWDAINNWVEQGRKRLVEAGEPQRYFNVLVVKLRVRYIIVLLLMFISYTYFINDFIYIQYFSTFQNSSLQIYMYVQYNPIIVLHTFTDSIQI